MGWAITLLFLDSGDGMLFLSGRSVPAESTQVKEAAIESAGLQDLSCLVLA
jgi:hypothetical protein